MPASSTTATASREPLSPAVAASATYQGARQVELDLLDERDDAISRAIRAGARLDEVAQAARVSKAAVSKAARKTLTSRTGRGGPYARRRGSSAALDGVAKAAKSLAAAREQTREARRRRNVEIARVVAQGAGVTETARAVGMTPASVSVIARLEKKPKPHAVGAAQLHRR
jgi:DNA-binding NarL/FixJ family response regulator